jgi:hypothetical protein
MTWVAVGTAAAVGAGVGGVSAAIQGNDVLTGALLGGATGALTGGAGTLASSAGTSAGTQLTTEAASQLAPELINTAAINAVPLDTVVQQAAPELLSQAAPELLEQAAPELLSQVAPAGIEQIAAKEFSAAELQALNQGYADSLAAQGTGVQSAGINNVGFTPSAAQPAPVPTPEAASNFGIKGVGPNPSAPGPFDTGVKPMIQGGDPRYASTMGQLQPSVSAPITPPAPVTPPPASNGFMQGFSQFAKDNPFLTGAGIYTVASTTGMLNQNGQQQPEEEENYTGPRLSADFKGGPYSGPNVYEEKRYNYASGGITEAYQSGGPVERMSQMNTAINPQGGLYPMGMMDKTQYATPTQRPVSAEMVSEMPAYERSSPMLMASGGITSVPRYYRGDLATSSGRRGDVYSATQRFLDMYDPQSKYTPPKDKGDVGIFRDTSTATRNKSAFDAAMTRQTALEKQSNVNTRAKLPRASRSAGQLNMKPQGSKAEKVDEYEYAASGGIMGASLGGYAAGGNPRLLKGPGDGMSDNIPAVIGRRQPARLADGEFVVPADVVSHLGNGSTEAGAKKLHSMMDNVRKARTGKKKQAPAVKANRFIPK